MRVGIINNNNILPVSTSFQAGIRTKQGITEIPLPKTPVDGAKTIIRGGNKRLIEHIRKNCNDAYRQAKFELDFARKKGALTRAINSKEPEKQTDTAIKVISLLTESRLNNSLVVINYISEKVLPALATDEKCYKLSELLSKELQNDAALRNSYPGRKGALLERVAKILNK